MLAGCAATALAHASAYANQETTHEVDIKPQELGAALTEFGIQTGHEILFVDADVNGKTTNGVVGEVTTPEAIKTLLDDTNVDYRIDDNGTLLVGKAAIRQANLRAEEERGGRFRVAQLDQEDDVREVDDVNQDEDDESAQDVIVVTGTNIRGISNDSSPVLSFDRNAIANTGFSTTQEFIQSLPQNFGAGASEDTAGFVFDRGNASLNPGFGSGVNLRGLGNDSTLVLVNGRRVAPGGFGTFVDISLIPISAIDRVDVLTDGASAIYGSDAVGGVVNFLLRDDYDGAETDLRFGTVTEGDSREYKVGQTIGHNWDAGNVLLSYEYFDRSNLNSQDRSFSADLRDQTDLLPDQKRHSALISASQELAESVEIFGFGSYSNREVTSFFANPNTMIDSRNDSDTEQLTLSTGIAFDIFEQWRGEFVGGFAETDASRQTTNVATTTPLSTTDTSSTIWSIDTKFDGPVFTLPGGEVRLAIGGQYRDETFSVDSGILLFDIDRDVVAAFGEIFVPIIGASNSSPGFERLEITAAGRFEDYSDFGSTTNPKVGLLWSPVNDLNLRATYGTSFRAPLLFELDTSSLSGLLANIPNPSSPSGTTLSLITFGFGPEGQQLNPEEATTWTVGFDFTPDAIPEFSVEFTYFDIDFDGRIAETNAFFDAFTDPEFASVLISPVPSDLVTALTSLPPGLFFNLTTSDPGDAEFLVDNRRRNIAATDVNGFDINLRYSKETGVGNLGVSLNANYLLNFEEQLTPSAIAFDRVDTVFNPVDLTLRGNLFWNHESGFGASAFINYTDSYTDDQVDPVEKVEAWTTVDLTLRYATRQSQNKNILDGTVLSLSIQNVFDNDPPLVNDLGFANLTGLGFDPENANPLGRYVAFQITKAW